MNKLDYTTSVVYAEAVVPLGLRLFRVAILLDFSSHIKGEVFVWKF